MAGTLDSGMMTWSRKQGKYLWNDSQNKKKLDLDRFIPNREGSDLDYGSYLASGGSTVKEIIAKTERSGFASSVAYQKHLAQALNMDRARIFSYRKPECPPKQVVTAEFTVLKPRRRIRRDAICVLDVPGLEDDLSLNLLDWGSNNVVAIALQDIVYLRNHSNRKQPIIDIESAGLVTSVGWAPNACHLAVGLSSSLVELWDCETLQLVRKLRGCHRTRIGALGWNSDNILTTGGRDQFIINSDIRVPSHVVETYKGHRGEVCGLKWSVSGETLASGGNDSRVFIWDRRQSSWLQKFESHSGTVKALAWSPFQANLLATGGGEDDRCIRFWNTRVGSCLNSVDTGSQVTALLWNDHKREVLSSHGSTKNELILWDYPSMVRRAAMCEHKSRVLYMCKSPDGALVASAAAGDDESLRFWDVFGEAPKPVPKQQHLSFDHKFNQLLQGVGLVKAWA